MNKLVIALSVAVFTIVNYGITVQRENAHLQRLIELSDARSDINQEWANEITHVMLNKLSTENEEGMRNQGRMEGIVEYLTNPKDYHSVWHEGYQRGLDQSEEMAKMERGELFPTDKPMPVKPNVIKKPDFDKKIEKVDSGGE
tara:strand:+ start:475 stop:903 length:429 start_codon:yes stop_codon:yes gene_type:complete